MSTAALERLAIGRARGTRASEQIVNDGLAVLRKGGLKKMGDEGIYSRRSPFLARTVN